MFTSTFSLSVCWWCEVAEFPFTYKLGIKLELNSYGSYILAYFSGWKSIFSSTCRSVWEFVCTCEIDPSCQSSGYDHTRYDQVLVYGMLCWLSLSWESNIRQWGGLLFCCLAVPTHVGLLKLLLVVCSNTLASYCAETGLHVYCLLCLLGTWYLILL